MDIPAEKRCSACLDIKPITDFYSDNTLPDKHRPQCKLCETKKRRARKFRRPSNCMCEYCHIRFYETPARKGNDRGRFCSRPHRKAFFAAQTSSEKVCKTCGISKPLDEFRTCKNGLYGREAHCRVCTSKTLSYELFIDSVLHPPMLMKQWRTLLLWYGLKYCPRLNHICHIDDFAHSRSAVTDKHAWWCKNCCHEIYQRDRNKFLSSKKQEYQKNSVVHRVRAKKKRQRYKKEKPELLLKWGQRGNAKRRAMLSYTILVEAIELEILAVRDNWTCHICHTKVTRKTWSADHLIPVSAKGETSYLNVALAHKSCNSSRGPGRRPAQLRLFGLITQAH